MHCHIFLDNKEAVPKCTAPKKLDTIWGHFYGKKSQVWL